MKPRRPARTTSSALCALCALCALLLVALGAGCMGLEPKSHPANPLGWPAKALSLGQVAADSEVPLYRETGRTGAAAGDLLESPALLCEGLLLFDGERLGGAIEKLVVGTGGGLTALINVPFFFVTGGVIDLGREEELVNDALAHMERDPVYPPGARVRSSGRNLVWTIPGEGEVVQSAEVSPALALGLGVTGMAHVAQARTWGFVVGSREKWEQCDRRLRAMIIVHEFYHQHMQIRRGFRGWSILYWPAYAVGTLAADPSEHWAENGGPGGAYSVNRALKDWRPHWRETDLNQAPDWIESDR